MMQKPMVSMSGDPYEERKRLTLHITGTVANTVEAAGQFQEFFEALKLLILEKFPDFQQDQPGTLDLDEIEAAQ